MFISILKAKIEVTTVQLGNYWFAFYTWLHLCLETVPSLHFGKLFQGNIKKDRFTSTNRSMNMISIQRTNKDMCEPRPRFIQTRKAL